MVEKRENWYLLHAKGGKPGEALNFGQLFTEGKYIFLLDAHDSFNASSLGIAAEYAANRNVDVLMLPYAYMSVRLERDGSIINLGIIETPENEKKPPVVPDELDEKKEIAVKTTSFAWNKLLRTELVTREDVYHGPTRMNEELQHHWHAILAAQSIDFFGGSNVVQHRVSTASPNMGDAIDTGRAFESLVDALAIGNRVLVRNGINEEKKLHRMWKESCERLVERGRLVMADDLKGEFEAKVEKLEIILKNKRSTELL